MMRFHAFVCAVLMALTLAGCETSKSSSPLSATIAGPISGVEISSPKLLEPNGARIEVENQPVTLLIENAPSNGPRPLTYVMEVATDADFTDKVFERQAIASGDGGRTTLQLPYALDTERSYYWRARAEDGANTGPFAAPASFEVYTPIAAPPPGGGDGSGHIEPGPATSDRARRVVFGTADEFTHLRAVFSSDGEAVAAAEELLRRTIWHLQLAGFEAGRQRNPSSAISNDKLTMFADGRWRVYDVYSLGFRGRATTVVFIEVPRMNHVPDGGIPD
jgi:hypothetical protein